MAEALVVRRGHVEVVMVAGFGVAAGEADAEFADAVAHLIYFLVVQNRNL